MTTNSPNPVDSDVQALIADCQAEIVEIGKMLALGGAVPYLKSQLQRQKVALAALTAEPVYQFIVNNPDKDGYIEWADCNSDYFSNEPSDSRRILYTNPPAQLLRPVELPKSQRFDGNGYGYYFDMDDVFRALEKSGVPFKSQG